MSEVLPKGWVLVPLKDIAGKIVDGSHNPPAKQDFGLPMLSARNVMDGTINFDEYRLISASDFEIEQRRTRISKSDVLLTIVGTIGRTAVVETNNNFTLQRSVAVIGDFNGADSYFVKNYFSSPRFQEWSNDNAKGTAQKGIYLRALGVVSVPLPPLPEQKRIVAKIDSLGAKSKRAKDHLNHIPKLVEKYKQAILKNAFKNNEGKKYKLGDLTPKNSTIRYGVLQPGGVKDHGVRMVRVCDINNGSIDWGEVRRISPKIDEQYRNARIAEGDILITVVGSIGRIALVENLSEPTNIARAVARIRPDVNIVEPTWLAWRLQSDDCQFVFANDAREVARKTLNISLVKDLEVQVPSLTMQLKIAEGIQTAFNWIDRLAIEATSARKLIDTLDKAILSKAFRGELVPQDPNDEPASVLLDRICNQSQPTSKKRKA